MELIVKWVMQIVVFILIATIIELITPENMLTRYVNLVVGLILILIFSQPLLHFLNVDMSAKLKEVESTMFNDEIAFNESKNLIENQKKDIQAEQDAYILSKVEKQLIDEASPTLFDQYQVTISQIDFIFQDKHLDKYEDLEEIIVTIQSQGEQDDEQDGIDPVVIELDKESDDSAKTNELIEKVTTLLKDLWDLHDKKITVKWEGGAS